MKNDNKDFILDDSNGFDVDFLVKEIIDKSDEYTVNVKSISSIIDRLMHRYEAICYCLRALHSKSESDFNIDDSYMYIIKEAFGYYMPYAYNAGFVEVDDVYFTRGKHGTYSIVFKLRENNLNSDNMCPQITFNNYVLDCGLGEAVVRILNRYKASFISHCTDEISKLNSHVELATMNLEKYKKQFDVVKNYFDPNNKETLKCLSEEVKKFKK